MKLGKKKTGKITLRDDWEKAKYDVMYTAIKAKFTQNKKIRKELLDTQDIELRFGKKRASGNKDVCFQVETFKLNFLFFN